MAERVCPVWVGYLLASPIRKLFQNPEKILGPHVKEGMTVLDVGCAMGFFTLPLASMVGPQGKAIAIDMQEKMLGTLQKRAGKAGLSERVETRICIADSLGLNDLKETVDFALTFAVVHEVPDCSSLFEEIHETLKPAGRLLVAEPRGHVPEANFAASVSAAELKGFRVVDSPTIRGSHTALLEKS